MAVVDHWNAAQLAGKRTHWLLDIVYAGKTYRLAQDALEVSSTRLGLLQYDPSIVSDVTFINEFSLFSDAVDAPAVTVETFFAGDDLTVLANQGHDLTGAPAILSKWIEGQDYDDRRVFLVGRLRDPEYGGIDVPARFTIEPVFFEDAALMPADSSRIYDATTKISNLDKEDFGLHYPIVIGYPGRYVDLTGVVVVAGSQGVWRCKAAEAQELIVAGHETQAAVCYLLNDDYTAGYPYVVTQATDDTGQAISVIASANYLAVTPEGAVAGLNGIAFRPEFLAVYYEADSADNVSTPVYVCWYAGPLQEQAVSGGLVINGELVRGAGDVAAYILSRSQYPVDRNRIKAVSAGLNSFLIDCTIDAQVKPWDWVAANLIPILPVSVNVGPNGVYLIRWDPNATSRDAVVSLDSDTDPSIEFGELISTDTSMLANEITLNYALDVRSDKYQQSLTMTNQNTHPRATATLITRELDSILLTSLNPGIDGNGIVINVDNIATGSILVVVSENLSAKTVNIQILSTYGPTVQNVITAINKGLISINARLKSGGGTQTVNGAYDIDESGTGDPSYHADAFSQTVTTTSPATRAEVYSYYCAQSQGRYREVANAAKDGKYPLSIDSLCVYESGTASAILSWMARAFAFAHRSVEATMPESVYGWIELGQTVTLTCARLGLSSVVAHVQALEYGGDGLIAARFTMIEDPLRNRRT